MVSDEAALGHCVRSIPDWARMNLLHRVESVPNVPVSKHYRLNTSSAVELPNERSEGRGIERSDTFLNMIQPRKYPSTVLAGAGRMAQPTNTSISARLKRAQGHVSHVE